MRVWRDRRFKRGGLAGAALGALALIALPAPGGGRGPVVLGEQLTACPVPCGFSLSGTSAPLLAPGDSTPTLSVQATNTYDVQITVTSLTVTVAPTPSVTSVPPNCPGTNLSLNGVPFAVPVGGGPPTVKLTSFPSPTSWTVPHNSSRVESIPIQLSSAVSNKGGTDVGCESATFPFNFSGTATFTASTTTGLASSSPSSLFGQSVTFTATVTADPTTATPAGSVTFYQCTSAVTSGPPTSPPCASYTTFSPAETVSAESPPVVGVGQATYTTSSLAAGSYVIFAAYTPTDPQMFSLSYSSTLTQTVGYTGGGCTTTSMNGGYTVASGKSMCISSPGRVTGGVTVKPGGALTLNGATVNGGVNATGATALQLCGSNINGGVSASGTTGFVMIGDGADEGSPGCGPNSVSGGLTLTNGTGSFEVGKNSITGGATFSGNSGSGPFGQDGTPEIEGNTITGGLSCGTNAPPPTPGGQPNAVKGSKSGQCSTAAGF